MFELPISNKREFVYLSINDDYIGMIECENITDICFHHSNLLNIIAIGKTMIPYSRIEIYKTNENGFREINVIKDF